MLNIKTGSQKEGGEEASPRGKVKSPLRTDQSFYPPMTYFSNYRKSDSRGY
jgi:hypothetical protein